MMSIWDPRSSPGRFNQCHSYSIFQNSPIVSFKMVLSALRKVPFVARFGMDLNHAVTTWRVVELELEKACKSLIMWSSS